MNTKEIQLNKMLSVPGLQFRKFKGDSDYPLMIQIIEAAYTADQNDESYTLADLENDYTHLTNCDPYQDMLFAQINDETIAYSRVFWYQEEKPNDRIYHSVLSIHPNWRLQGIEQAMLYWCEKRLATIMASHPEDSKRYYQIESNDKKQAYNHIIENLGYQPARYGFAMSRSLDDIPQVSLQDGIVVKPAVERDYRKIWDASIEAFRDHWGFSQPTEEDYQAYINSKYFQPDLWQVAWHGNQVVSSVLNYIDEDYNQKFNKKRGWTEQISTHRDYRRKGIAKALIVRSMYMHQAKGMTEVALGVDTDNPNGALKLYEGLGYRQEKTWITYRKPTLPTHHERQ
jgi:ribosomal protein S18 acetylase RimI-like enzyme